MNYDLHCDNVSNSIGKWLDRVFKHPQAIQIAEGSPLDKAIDAYRQLLADAIHAYEGKTPAQTYMECVIGMRIGELDRHKIFDWITQTEYDLRKSEIFAWGERQLERVAEDNLSVADLEAEDRQRQIQNHLLTSDLTQEEVKSMIEKAHGKKPTHFLGDNLVTTSNPHPPITPELEIECPPFDIDVESKRKKLSRLEYYALSFKVLLIYPALDIINRKRRQLLKLCTSYLEETCSWVLALYSSWILEQAYSDPKHLERLAKLPEPYKKVARQQFFNKCGSSQSIP